MKLLNFFSIIPLLLVAGIADSAQSTRSPSDQPSATVGNEREPKVNKSRLRDVKGIVNDNAEQPLDGAIVQLKDLKSGKVVDFRTQGDGKFLFYDLNMDQDYELKVLKDGFAESGVKKVSRFDTRKPATFHFELERKKAQS